MPSDQGDRRNRSNEEMSAARQTIRWSIPGGVAAFAAVIVYFTAWVVFKPATFRADIGGVGTLGADDAILAAAAALIGGFLLYQAYYTMFDGRLQRRFLVPIDQGADILGDVGRRLSRIDGGADALRVEVAAPLESIEDVSIPAFDPGAAGAGRASWHTFDNNVVRRLLIRHRRERLWHWGPHRRWKVVRNDDAQTSAIRAYAEDRTRATGESQGPPPDGSIAFYFHARRQNWRAFTLLVHWSRNRGAILDCYGSVSDIYHALGASRYGVLTGWGVAELACWIQTTAGPAPISHTRYAMFFSVSTLLCGLVFVILDRQRHQTYFAMRDGLVDLLVDGLTPDRESVVAHANADASASAPMNVGTSDSTRWSGAARAATE